MPYHPRETGRVFTPPHIVDLMLSLRRSRGRTLEPSCGGGAISDALVAEGADLVAIELDADHAPPYARVMDFFDLPSTERFSTVIANPPYVRASDILPPTMAKLDFSGIGRKGNLFLFFVRRAAEMLEDGGELVFIVPREMTKLIAAAELNRWLYEHGTITDVVVTGDVPVFGDAAPPCMVFRYGKGDMSRRTMLSELGGPPRETRFACSGGQLLFLSGDYSVPFSDAFEVRVGGASGARPIFSLPGGNADVVGSTTFDTGEARRMWVGDAARDGLAGHKGELMARRIRRFGEHNWWEWGRGFQDDGRPRVYVNNFTRRERPFFTHPCGLWDNSVFGVFPRADGLDMDAVAGMLNGVDWADLGFLAGGRLVFGQGMLENCILPERFRELVPGEPKCPR